MAETLQRYRNAGIPIERAMPKIFVALRVSVSVSLDLTKIDIEQVFGFPLDELLHEDWRLQHDRHIDSLGQAIGRAAFGHGIEALLVPSAADSAGTNIVLFPDVLKAGSEVTAEGVQ